MPTLAELQESLDDALVALEEADEAGDLEERLRAAHRVANLNQRIARLRAAASG